MKTKQHGLSVLMTLSHQRDKHSTWLLLLVGHTVGQWVKNTAFVEEPKFGAMSFGYCSLRGLSEA